MAKTYQQFYKETNGKSFDIDGYYGAQCWDGAMYYLKWLGYSAIHCGISGYVKDIWNARKTNGILNYCIEVTELQPGDVVVFREVAGWTPLSHIAMFHADIDGTYGYFYGQNQGGANGAFNLTKLPYSATFDTAFRPKCFVKGSSATTTVIKKSNMEEENWAVRFINETPITIHKDTSTGASGGTFCKGETQIYTHKGVGAGHRWIGWTEGTQFYVCAISDSETRGEEMWVELVDPETLNTAKKEEVKEEVKKYEDTLDEAENIDLKEEILESQQGLNITVSLVDKKHYKARCPYVMTPEYIVIHNAETKNGTAKSLCAVQNKDVETSAQLKSWHFSVDENGAYQSLPLNRNGFHASDGADGDGNRKGIAIEIARDNAGEEKYADAAEDNGALLAAILLNKYGWDTSHLKAHHDFAKDKKWCPHRILDNGWEKFVEKVQKNLDKIQGSKKEETIEKLENAETNYLQQLLKIITEMLNNSKK